MPFEVLMDASHAMLEHYKERLAETDSHNQTEWGQKGFFYLVRCFFTLHQHTLESLTCHVIATVSKMSASSRLFQRTHFVETVQKEKGNFVVVCLGSSEKVKLGNLTS